MALSLALPIVNQPVVIGSTSKSFFIYMSGPTGVPVTGKVFNATGLVASYAGSKLARVAITLVDLAAITTAWASGGFKEVDATNMPGWYRIDVPNAALALSADEVVIECIDQDGTGDSAGTLVIPLSTGSLTAITATLAAADLGNPLTGTLAQNVEAIAAGIPFLDVIVDGQTTRTDH